MLIAIPPPSRFSPAEHWLLRGKADDLRRAVYLADGVPAATFDSVDEHDARSMSWYLVDATDDRKTVLGTVRARQFDSTFGQVSGLAVCPTAFAPRRTGARLVVGMFELAKIMRMLICFATVTTRNHTPAFLERIGGHKVLTYMDPRFGCEMALMAFETAGLNPVWRKLGDETAGEIRRSLGHDTEQEEL